MFKNDISIKSEGIFVLWEGLIPKSAVASLITD